MQASSSRLEITAAHLKTVNEGHGDNVDNQKKKRRVVNPVLDAIEFMKLDIILKPSVSQSII